MKNADQLPTLIAGLLFFIGVPSVIIWLALRQKKRPEIDRSQFCKGGFDACDVCGYKGEERVINQYRLVELSHSTAYGGIITTTITNKYFKGIVSVSVCYHCFPGKKDIVGFMPRDTRENFLASVAIIKFQKTMPILSGISIGIETSHGEYSVERVK